MKISLIAIALAGLVGFYGGYSLRSTQAKAENAIVLKQHIREIQELSDLSREIEISYAEKAAVVKTVYKTIIKKVPVYVTKIQKTDSDCNLTTNTISLLNHAAKNQLPEAATKPNPKNTAAPRIRESDLIHYTHELISQYNSAMVQCNALIDWAGVR